MRGTTTPSDFSFVNFSFRQVTACLRKTKGLSNKCSTSFIYQYRNTSPIQLGIENRKQLDNVIWQALERLFHFASISYHSPFFHIFIILPRTATLVNTFYKIYCYLAKNNFYKFINGKSFLVRILPLIPSRVG